MTAGELIASSAKALGKGGTLYRHRGSNSLTTVTTSLSGDLNAGAATIASAHGATLTLNESDVVIDAGIAHVRARAPTTERSCSTC